MNKQFSDRLTEYLDSEINDYGLSYSWEWVEDCNHCEVTIGRENNLREIIINFRFDGKDLLIELSEDSYYPTREYDKTVKYLWMLIGAKLMYD